jgi:pSer/pThr/pTyr-binding forkhead associated (FHA) protein/tetratricopeptide (TPR) repeat protein
MYRLKVHLHGAEMKELNLESGHEYKLGRGETCDIQLTEGSAISRVHFRLVEENGVWTAQVVSKFGDIYSSGQPVRHLNLEGPTVFKLGPYDFYFALVEQPQVEQVEEKSSNVPVAIGQNLPAPTQSPGAASQFSGNDEATNIATSIPELPQVRIVETSADGTSRSHAIILEGRKWLAGREDGVDILLNDKKASRRQFEITSTPQGYFIRDLGSSNGTSLNNTPLAHDELKAIRSGDLIQVGNLLIYFEIRDPHFDKKLMVVQPNGMSDHGIIVQSPYEMINYPVAQGPGGAVRIDGNQGWLGPVDQGAGPFGNQLDAAKKRKMRFWMIAGGILALIVLFLVFSDDKPKAKPSQTASAFEKLSPNQKKQVRELYVMANNLYMQKKMALALAQFQKLHAILPEGYEQSLVMSKDCAEAAEQDRMYEELLRKKREAEAIARMVAKTLADCDQLSKTTTDLNAINTCLKPALDQDPENPQVQEQIARVRNRIELNEIKDKERKAYQVQVAKGEALYKRAFDFEKNGEFIDALEAYRKHTESPYPDPKSLKALSRKQILTITKQMSAMIEETLKAAEASWGVQNYAQAFDAINRAKKMDPRNIRVQELNGKYRRELNTKLKEIYEDAVISEGLGDVDGAKTRWTNILKMDSADGEYYKKAKNKLKQYGAF